MILLKVIWTTVMSLIATPFLFFMVFLEARVKGIGYGETNAASHLQNLALYLEEVTSELDAWKKEKEAKLQKMKDEERK